MSAVAEHIVIVYKWDAYRFPEYRRQYEEYVYIQCFQPELVTLGIAGFFIKTVEEDPIERTQIFGNPNVMTGSPLGMITQ